MDISTSNLLFPNVTFVQILGQGTSAIVEEYFDPVARFAIKKFTPSNNGINSSVLWEFHCLRVLRRCPFIMPLRSVIIKQIGPTTYANFRLDLYPQTMHDFVKRTSTQDRIRFYDRIFDQLLTGLATIHAAGLIHRDIKPGNILMNSLSQCVIADFGLAYQHDLCFDYNVYTLWYRPPEIISKIPYDESADVWAMGVTLLEYLTGMTIFKSSDNQDTTVLKKIMNNTINGHLNVRQILDHAQLIELSDQQINSLKSMLKICPSDRVKTSDIIPSHSIMKIRKLRMPSRVPNRCMKPLIDEIYSVTTWMIRVAEELEFRSPTVICSIDLMERYIAHHLVDKRILRIVAATCLFLGCELMEPKYCAISQIVMLMKKPVAIHEIKSMQINILIAMNFFIKADEHQKYLKMMVDVPVRILMHLYDAFYLEAIYPGDLTYQQIEEIIDSYYSR